LAGILLASGGSATEIPNTTQCREWGYGRYTERDLLAAILLATGTGASVTWGSITGTLSDQTDLQTALNAKLNLTGGTLSGALNFSGTTHAGIRLNNLTTTERNAIGSPAAGMLLWNTTQARMNVHNGSAWTDGFVRLAGDAMTGALSVTLTGLGTTPTAGFSLINSTAATSGNQQISPSLVLEGQGWKTTATAASQPVQYHLYTLPVQGTANPTVDLIFASSINGGAVTERMRLTSGGALYFGGSNPSFANISNNSNELALNYGTTRIIGIMSGEARICNAASLGFSSSNSTADVYLRRRSSATLQMGIDSATPISQTLGVCLASGANTTGANFTLAAGQGTGTGTPGLLLFQTSTAIGSGSTAQTLATRMTLNATDLVMASGIGLQLGNAAVAAVPVATHTVTIKDSTGTTYRLLCVV
jgi:hypothetical protein